MRRVIAVALLLCWASAAEARSLAVLEFRAGATGAKRIAHRAAQILRQRTSQRIMDVDDARRVAGPKIDETLAGCGGQAACIAGIGKKLGVDEVVVVGVSELGDLILALQRVETRSGAALGRIADSLPRGEEPDDAALEGYLRRLLPREDFLRYGTLRIDADVPGAEVRLGGESKGKTPLAPIVVPAPQTVDLRVSKDGYSDFRARIDVTADATVEVRPLMTRRPGASWYEKPWVWAIAGAVVAGGVATAVILTRPADRAVPIDVALP